MVGMRVPGHGTAPVGLVDTDWQDMAAAVKIAVRHLRERQSDYQCEHCGFVARHLHWQCPSCKHWNSIKPIQGVEGE